MGETREEIALKEGAETEVAVPVPQSRALAAVALRLAGASYAAIAEIHELGSPTIARQVVEEALAASVDEQKDVPKMRALTSLRLERLLQSIWGPATDAKNKDHLNYARTALALVDRISKLHGTDAPQRVEVSTPDSERKEAWLRLAVQQIGGLNAIEEEAEIIDAVVVEGDF